MFVQWKDLIIKNKMQRESQRSTVFEDPEVLVSFVQVADLYLKVIIAQILDCLNFALLYLWLLQFSF